MSSTTRISPSSTLFLVGGVFCLIAFGFFTNRKVSWRSDKNDQSNAHPIVPVKKKLLDSKTEEILNHIFTVDLARQYWNETNQKSTVPTRIICLTKKQCLEKGILNSTCLHEIRYDRLFRNTIYYSEELDRKTATIYLLIEIMNAHSADLHLQLAKLAAEKSITNRVEYANAKEKLEWEATCIARTIISQLFPGAEKDPRFCDDFETYLTIQREGGHTKIYEHQFLRFQS